MQPTRFKLSVKSILSFGIILVFLTVTAYYVYDNYKEFKNILNVPWANLAMLYLLFAALLYLTAMYTRYTTSAFGLRLSAADCLMLSAATSSANYLMFFRGGAGVRALYLKSKHSFAYTDFVSTLSAMYLLHFFISGAMGLAGLSLLIWRGLPFDWPFAIFFAASSIFSALILLCHFRITPSDRFPLREIARVVNGWSILRNDPSLMLRLLINTLLNYLVFLLQTKVAFSTYGVDLGWGASLFYTSGRIPVSFANITPGAIGILEGFSVYMGHALRYTPAEALQVQALIRIVSISTLLVAGPWAFSRMGGLSHQSR